MDNCICGADEPRQAPRHVALDSAITKYSILYEVRRELVEGIIYQESVICSDNPQYASRFEEKFYEQRLRDKPISNLAGYLPSTIHPSRLPSLYDEKISRAHSYGWMQILGETARGQGFKGQFLQELFDTDTNIRIGCGYLAKCLRAFRSMSVHDQEFQALARYNGSSSYPPKIFEHIKTNNHLLIYK